MQKQIQKVSQATGLDQLQIEHILKIAMQEAFCKYLNVLECEIDNLNSRLIKAVFRIRKEMPVVEAEIFQTMVCEDDIITVDFDFGVLPVVVQHQTHDLFVRHIDNARLNKANLKWKKMVHGAINGVVKERNDDYIVVDLGDDNVVGIMSRQHWTPKEIPLYLEGRAFLFYLLKITKTRHVIKIHLSRISKNLPCSILFRMAPWIRVKTIKRIAGKKTWITTNSSIELNMINELRRELKGEAVEIKTNV